MEETASFEEDEATFEEESATKATQVTGLIANGPVQHVDHYLPPQHYPERQQRSIQQSNYMWLIPMILILSIATIIFKKEGKTIKMKRTVKNSHLLVLITGAIFMMSGMANAIVYSSLKDAVTLSLGSGQKIYQAHIPITPEAKSYLKKTIGWTPEKKAYKVFYIKSKTGTPMKYAYVLKDKLSICGGLHKYCVTLTADGAVSNVKILELSCDRSYTINTRSFLSQFKSFNINSPTDKNRTYDAITGATQSADLTGHIVKRALALHKIMKDNK